MIVETGHFALILCFFVALAQAALGLCARGQQARMLFAARGAQAVFALSSIAFLALAHAYALSDMSVANVARNSHSFMPLVYKITAVWGNHEGSMLLWVWVLAVWGVFFARTKTVDMFFARTLGLMGGMVGAFAAFTLLTSNPFLRLTPPATEGAGLNPVLQDIALALHPPLLYAGYVGFALTFCMAAAALLEARFDAARARAMAPWVRAAWGFLTAGIVLGSVWAYYELGWGGFWFWDPVENASLMPWLAGLALLHALPVAAQNGSLRGWTLFLCLLTFALSLLGTFLVRSGIITSVHAFASDPARGAFILILLAAMTGAGFALWALRAPQLEQGRTFAPASRETALVLNNVLLFTFCATVVVGTFYPVFVAVMGAESVSVGAPYFTSVLLPLLAPFALLTGVAPFVPWRAAIFSRLFRRTALPAGAALILTALAFCLPVARGGVVAVSGVFLGLWVLAATGVYAFKTRLNFAGWRMVLGHAGFGLVLLGATAATQWRQETVLWMTPGLDTAFAGHRIAFLGVETGLGPDYNADRGVFAVYPDPDGQNRFFFMKPEKRWYPVAETETTEAALRASGGGLLYIVLGDADDADNTRRVVRLYHHPFVLTGFAGGFIMALGGLLPFFTRRRRTGDA